MATLHVRNVPDPLYKQLQKLAGKKSRSLGAEVVTLLDRAVREEAATYNVEEVFKDIARRRSKMKRTPPGFDSVTLLREDRDR